MLSKNAFNALLKTLEEPPAHVKFIFATTEVKKIPITIISRCQRFDLHRIENDKLTKHLANIASKEKIKINLEAIALIVRSADGSVRDGLSLLDQAIANETEEITSISITKMLGLADRGNIFELMDAIFKGDPIKSLQIYNKIHNSGADILMIFNEMLNVTHFITQIKIIPELKLDIHIPELERTKGFEISEKISMASLGIVWQILFKGYEELQMGFHLFQHGEMLIIRLLFLNEGPTPDDLIKKFKSENIEEKKFNNDSEITSNNEITSSTVNTIDISVTNEKISNSSSHLKNVSLGNLSVKSYRNFVDLFYQKREGMLHTYLYNNAKLITFKEGEVIINVKTITDPHFTRIIAKLVSTWTGRIWQVSSSSSNIGQTLQEKDLIEQQKQINKMKNNPEVKSILDMFPGIKIHSITNIGETAKENISSDILKQKKEK